MATAAASDPHLAAPPPSTAAPAAPAAPVPGEASPPTSTSTPPLLPATSATNPASPQLPSLPAPVFSTPSSPRQPPSSSSPLFSSSPAATSSGFSPTGRASRSPSALRPVRRQSTHERLNDILETARHRAEAYSAQYSQPVQPTAGARHATFVPMEPLLRNQSAPGAFAGIAEHESSADETTGIVSNPRGTGRRSGPSRGDSARHLNYQSTATMTSTYGSASASASLSRSSSGPRSRKAANAGGSDDRGLVAQTTSSSGGAAGGGSRGGSRSRGSGGASARGPNPAANRGLDGGGGGGWWKEFWAGFQSIELENKGSVARDHLALERTFLAWLRTSLAFASIGIAVTQLFRLNTSTSSGDAADGLDSLRHVGRPLGTTFLAISVLILFLGYHRYYQTQQWILKGKFPASRGTILIVSLVAFALMVTSLVVVVVVQPSRT